MTIRRSLTGSLLAAALLAGCTIVTPPDDGGQKVFIPVPNPPPPPPPLKANLLFVVNMHRTATNLADDYAKIINELVARLKDTGLVVDSWGATATYPDELGTRLLFGRRDTSTKPTPVLGAAALLPSDPTYAQWLAILNQAAGDIAEEDVPTALRMLAGSGNYDGDLSQSGEGQTPISLGHNAGVASLPAGMGGLERDALFAAPRNLFIVVYLQAIQRPCNLQDPQCQVDGVSPLAAFLQTDVDGNATWLKFVSGALRPEQIVHVAITTPEGMSSQEFRTSCGAVPGFPMNLLDMMQPSSAKYYGPLIDGLEKAHPGTGHMVNICELMGRDSADAIKVLAKTVASMARK